MTTDALATPTDPTSYGATADAPTGGLPKGGIPTGAVALYAEFTATEGNGDTVAALIADFGVVVRREAGNIRFDVHRLASNPSAFFVYEIYRDRAAFDEHLAAPAGAVFNGRLTPLVVGGGSSLTMLTPVAEPAASSPATPD